MSRRAIFVGVCVLLVLALPGEPPLPPLPPGVGEFAVSVICVLPAVFSNVVGVPVRHTSAKGMGTHHPELCYAGRVGASWHYNWVSDLAQCDGVESVPMIYCGVHLEYIEQGHYILMDSAWVMGFNEPDDARQSNMTPQEAAAAWPRVEALARGRKLASPAVVWHPSWLAEFRDAYIARCGKAPRLDALAVHCYANDVAACQEHIGQVVAYAVEWGIAEVWVTEFMLWDGAEQHAPILIAWMETHPMITRYAWFPGTLTGDEDWLAHDNAASRARYLTYQLVSPDGTLTPMGQIYAGAH